MISDKRTIDVKPALVLVLLLFFLPGCDKTSDRSSIPQTTKNKSADAQNLKGNIGWIHGTCLAIRNSKLNPGTPIEAVLLSKPQKIVDAKITGSAAEPNSECFALLSDRAEVNKQDGRFFYKLDISKESLNTMAIGLVSKTVKARNRNSIVEFDLNQDGIVERADTCLTSEGVQFYISSSGIFDGKALWSDYYYLGYDTKPTCP